MEPSRGESRGRKLGLLKGEFLKGILGSHLFPPILLHFLAAMRQVSFSAICPDHTVLWCQRPKATWQGDNVLNSLPKVWTQMSLSFLETGYLSVPKLSHTSGNGRESLMIQAILMLSLEDGSTSGKACFHSKSSLKGPSFVLPQTHRSCFWLPESAGEASGPSDRAQQRRLWDPRHKRAKSLH